MTTFLNRPQPINCSPSAKRTGSACSPDNSCGRKFVARSIGPAESRPRGIVHRLFSQDFRRPDRTGDEFPAAAIVRAACRSGPLCARAAIDRLGPIQESRHRRQSCAIGRSQLQDRRLRPAARTLDQHIFLRLPDLLRLFRLYRYRARHLVAVRPHADGELPPAVLSRSTTEFWAERWHISLGRWFRDYLYIPLGGSRAGALRRAINIMVVFLVSGLWHAGLGYGVGWTFLVWGALNGAYQWAGAATRGLWRRIGEALPRVAASAWLRVFRIVITFHLILLSWVFFRAGSMHDALLVLQRIGARLTDLPHLLTIYPFSAEQLTGFGLIAFLLVYEIFDERRPVFQPLAAAPVALRWGAYYLGIFALLLLGRWQAKEFIYMQF